MSNDVKLNKKGNKSSKSLNSKYIGKRGDISRKYNHENNNFILTVFAIITLLYLTITNNRTNKIKINSNTNYDNKTSIKMITIIS